MKMAHSSWHLLCTQATYYGDREVDVAMTEVFGGFGRDFYKGKKGSHGGHTSHTRLFVCLFVCLS